LPWLFLAVTTGGAAACFLSGARVFSRDFSASVSLSITLTFSALDSDSAALDLIAVGSDAGFDTGFDAGFDTGFDAGCDAGCDTGFDAGLDTVGDTGFDAGFDAGLDAGFASVGVQAGVFAGAETGETCTGAGLLDSAGLRSGTTVWGSILEGASLISILADLGFPAVCVTAGALFAGLTCPSLVGASLVGALLIFWPGLTSLGSEIFSTFFSVAGFLPATPATTLSPVVGSLITNFFFCFWAA